MFEVRRSGKRDGIDPGPPEGVATRQPASRQHRPAQRAVLRDGFDRVGLTGRQKTTGAAKEGRQHHLVDANKKDQEFRCHYFDRKRRFRMVR